MYIQIYTEDLIRGIITLRDPGYCVLHEETVDKELYLETLNTVCYKQRL